MCQFFQFFIQVSRTVRTNVNPAHEEGGQADLHTSNTFGARARTVVLLVFHRHRGSIIHSVTTLPKVLSSLCETNRSFKSEERDCLPGSLWQRIFLNSGH